MRFSLVTLSTLIILNQCGRSPSSSTEPGVCPLSCNYSQIATKDMSIRLLHEESIELSCQDLPTNTTYKNPIPIRFVIEKNEETTSSSSTDSSSTSTSTSTDTSTTSSTTTKTPSSAISFEAIILTGFMLDQPNPGDPAGQNKYKGILTTLDEWCTDACGVGAVDIAPLCKKKENIVKILLRSGSISKTITVKVKPPNSEL